MKIGYEQENWDVYLAAKNLTDKEYVVEGYEDPSLGYVGCVGPPRTIILTCSYRFWKLWAVRFFVRAAREKSNIVEGYLFADRPLEFPTFES